jgi:hypothetical protein
LVVPSPKNQNPHRDERFGSFPRSASIPTLPNT